MHVIINIFDRMFYFLLRESGVGVLGETYLIKNWENFYKNIKYLVGFTK